MVVAAGVAHLEGGGEEVLWDRVASSSHARGDPVTGNCNLMLLVAAYVAVWSAVCRCTGSILAALPPVCPFAVRGCRGMEANGGQTTLENYEQFDKHAARQAQLVCA